MFTCYKHLNVVCAIRYVHSALNFELMLKVAYLAKAIAAALALALALYLLCI